MSAAVQREQARTARGATLTLLPFTLVMFLGYSAVGIPISTLPLQVHGLGYGTAVVGAVMGLGFVTTLLTRQIAGGLADRRGPKIGVFVGLALASLSGVIYLVSTALAPAPALAVLMVGRVMVGLGDSLFTTALTGWVVARVGSAHAGRALSWNGIAMYGAMAVGAPVGAVLSGWHGFPAVSAAVILMPLLAVPLVAAMVGLPGSGARRASVLGVVGVIWPAGLSMVLASGGFGTIASFLALHYADRGWSGAGLALTAFGGAYIVSRLFLAGLPDRIGGARVAMVFLAVEAAGLVLIATAGSPAMALLGTGLTGLGYSLVFPSLGVEVVRRVAPEHRSMALGAFLACFDLGLGGAGPVMGILAAGQGLPVAFLAASAACVVSLLLVWTTRVQR